MIPENSPIRPSVLIGLGVASGMAIAAVDNLTFEGEVSPIIIVGMLFAVTATSGVTWDWRGWFVTAAAWVCVPLTHLVKHVLGLKDTLHPNTYPSILKLAAFTFVVSAVGIGCGVLLRRLIRVVTKGGP